MYIYIKNITKFMKLLWLLPFLILSCTESNDKLTDENALDSELLIKTNDNNSFESDLSILDNAENEILNTINNYQCMDSEDWQIAAIGTKACGGPQYYVAYPKENTDLLNSIEIYSLSEEVFNEKWSVISTCDIAVTPLSVSCEDNRYILNYE